MTKQLNYDVSHLPTVHRFISDDTSTIKAISGAMGSGKSAGCIFDDVYKVLEQEPNSKGERLRKVLIFKKNFNDYKGTIVSDINSALGDFGYMGAGSPISGKFTFPHPDGTKCILEYIGLAAEDFETAQKSIKSMNVTAIWINEADQIDERIVGLLMSRRNRYPIEKGKNSIKIHAPQIKCDFNLANKDSWVYKWFVEGKMNNISIQNAENDMQITYYEQPPPIICTNYDEVKAKNVDPEYIMNENIECPIPHAERYYRDQLRSMTDFYDIERNLLLKWVDAPVHGDRIHKEFTRVKHVRDANYVEGIPLIIGIDTSGLHPASVFTQIHSGRLVTLDEFYIGDVHFDRYREEIDAFILENYNKRDVIFVCDPANARASSTGMTPIQDLIRSGYRAVPACKVNNLAPRREATTKAFNRENHAYIDRRCEMLIAGLDKHYIHKRRKLGDGTYINLDEAHKNEHSHLCEAFQYACIYHFNDVRSEYSTQYRQSINPKKKIRFNRYYG